MLVYARSNFWVRDLHQQGAYTTEEREYVLAVDPADDGIIRKEPWAHETHLTE